MDYVSIKLQYLERKSLFLKIIINKILYSYMEFSSWWSICSLWNLEMLVFVKGRKLDYPENNAQSKTRTNNKLNWQTAQDQTWLQ